MKSLKRCIGFVTTLTNAGAVGLMPKVPEIDPGSVASAVGSLRKTIALQSRSHLWNVAGHFGGIEATRIFRLKPANGRCGYHEGVADCIVTIARFWPLKSHATHLRRKTLMRWLKRHSNRTFALYPALIFLFEYLWHGWLIHLTGWNLLVGVPLLIGGYGLYRLSGNYRQRVSGGGTGVNIPPARMVEQGIYAYTRNPMYLGNLIFMLGLAVTFWSWAALLLLAFHIYWYQQRVLKDEERLTKIFGAPYVDYQRRVRRWVPHVI